MNIDFSVFIRLVRDYHSFVLTSHVNPDGDALGSELALARSLRRLGKTVTILNHSGTPLNYSWMDPQSDIRTFEAGLHAELIRTCDVLCVLDTNHPDRLKSLGPHVVASPAIKVVIDHHLDPHTFAHHYFIDLDASSTGEILFRLITSFTEFRIDQAIAVPLYAAIMTDSGSFRHPRTDAELHRMTARLIEAGADPTEIYRNIFETWTPGRVRLLGSVLDSMQLRNDGKLAYVVCLRSSFQETGTTEADTDHFTNYPMSVEGVVLGIMFMEVADGVKISFRSRGNIPVNELAKEFGGNGHMNAAGTRIDQRGIHEIIPLVLDRATRYLEPVKAFLPS